MLYRVLVCALVVLASLRAGEAQETAKSARIGYLSPLSADGDSVNREAFREGLRALGYLEGRNVVIEARYADGRPDVLVGLAADLVRLKVDVIVAAPTPAVRAARQATSTIPIVMAFSGDPVGDGLVASLARPGGNITGCSATVPEVAVKRVEFLRAIVPKATRLTHLIDPDSVKATVTETEAAGRSLGVRVITTYIRSSRDVQDAFATKAGANIGGVIVSLSLQPYWSQIVDLALKHRVPSVSGPWEFVRAGGLMAYGPDYPELFRRSATFVDKILKGAKPADLPVEQPTKFDFVISGKTAKALGLIVPPSLLVQASRVVE